jgi:hypothetical protein
MKWREESRFEAARSELEKRIQELDGAVAVCDELLALLRELDGLTHDPEQFNRRLARVDELRTRIGQDSRPYMLVNAFTQEAELRRYSADRRIGAEGPEDAARAKRRIARDIEFLTAVREGALEVKPILDAARDRMHA